MKNDGQNQRARNYTAIQYFTSVVAAALISSCSTTGNATKEDSLITGETIRLTAEPWRPQDVSDRVYHEIASELTRRAKRKFIYVPALSYGHAQNLASEGIVDVLFSGSYGTYLTIKRNPMMKIIAVESPSARSALVGNADEESGRPANGSVVGLKRVLGQRVGFGSRYAGLGSSMPLLEMAKQGITTKDVDTCTYIADQELLKRNITEGQLDYAFIRLNKDDEEQGFASNERLRVEWKSPKRQDFIVSIGNRMLTSKNSRLRRELTNLLLGLEGTKPNDQPILDGLDVEKLEEPTGNYPGKAFMELQSGESGTLVDALRRCS